MVWKVMAGDINVDDNSVHFGCLDPTKTPWVKSWET